MDERDVAVNGGPEGAPSLPFDWATARRRLAAAGVRLAMLDGSLPASLSDIWARRAAELARRHDPEDVGEQIDVVIVRLGRELYGLEAQYVLEIRLLEAVTRVPRVPVWVVGLVNLRGRILSVIDLPTFWGLPARDAAGAPAASFVLVVETPDLELALRADEVLAVEAVPGAALSSPSDLVRGLRPEFVRGVYTRSGPTPTQDGAVECVTVLDLPALLADRSLIVYDEAT